MKTYQVAQSKDIPSEAALVYSIIADYKNGHPRIIPPKYFSNLIVEDGSGSGDGTRIRFDMTVLGKTRTARAVVTEPKPGRVLVETELSGSVVTTFTVEPRPEGAGCRVTIATTLKSRPGILGALERFAAKTMLRKIYGEELDQLARVAQERVGGLKKHQF
jgi:hypothetical protein